MTNADRPEFAQALGVMAETFGQPLSELRVEGYFAALRDLDLDDVLHGITRAMREDIFNVLPTPGKIRTYAQGSEQDQSEAAWLALCETVRRVGYYGRPVLPPSLAATVEAVWGGWQAACRELPAPNERNYEQHRNRFLAAYRVVRQRQELPPAMPKGLIA